MTEFDGRDGRERRVTITPDRLVAGGDAFGRLADGRVVFASGVLPGETAQVDVVEDRGDFVRASLGSVADIHDPSDLRIEPACGFRHHGCGGCAWMHLEASAQIEAKAGIVRESLSRLGRIDPDVVAAVVSAGDSVPDGRYRTTIRLAGTGSGVGFRRERRSDVVSVDRCVVAHEAFDDVIPLLDVSAGIELTLRVSAATGAMTALWTSSGRTRRGGRPSGPAVSGLPPHVHTGERAYLVEGVGDVRLRVSAGSFFQSGPAACELLVDAVGRAAPELAHADHAVDAYGGVGMFAATVMSTAEHVTLVESSASACRDAEQNLADRSAAIVRSEVGAWSAAGSRPVDVVVADPARPGLGRPGARAVIESGAPVAVLVSCDPASLGRDARLLIDAGFDLEAVEALDLAPQTHHVETVARFTR